MNTDTKTHSLLIWAREKAKGNFQAALEAIDAAIDCSESAFEIESLSMHRKETAAQIASENPKPAFRRFLSWFWSDRPVKSNE